MSHGRTAPSTFATCNTLALVQALLWQFIQPDANSMLAMHAAPMEGTRCITSEAETSGYPQGRGWKGRPVSGCLSRNFTQGSYRVSSGKKQVMGRAWWHVDWDFQIALYLLPGHTSFQPLIYELKAEHTFLFQEDGGVQLV